MTGGNLELAYLFIQTAAAAVLLIIGGIMVSKVMNLYRQRARFKCEVENQAYFVRLQNGFIHDDAFPKPEGALNKVEKAVVQAKLMAWIDRVEGISRDKLITLCEELGFVEQEMAQLQSRFTIRKTRAAYRLGLMRSKRATPALLEELRKQPFGTSLFIIARAVAQCSRGTDDLEKMVMQIVKHRKPVYEITAAILEEVTGDLTELMERLLLNGNPDTNRIAMLCLDKDQTIREGSFNEVVALKESLLREGLKPTSSAI
jgi:hypothetical protein